MVRRVSVEPYIKEWVSKFNEEKNALHNIFGDEVIEIYHIGSTSVKGLFAKPVIDMMPVVNDIRNVYKFNDAMEAIGYEPKGENGIRGRRFFRKGGDNRSHHVHVFEEGSPDVKRHLAFRDYLRSHDEVARQYGELKITLSQQHHDDIEAYINGKEHLVQDIEQKALYWYRGE